MTSTPPGTAAFADPGDLRYRIRRLQQPPPGGTRRSLALALADALLTPAVALAACQALRTGVTWPGLAGCLALLGYPGWRPAWARRRRLKACPP